MTGSNTLAQVDSNRTQEQAQHILERKALLLDILFFVIPEGDKQVNS